MTERMSSGVSRDSQVCHISGKVFNSALAASLCLLLYLISFTNCLFVLKDIPMKLQH